VTSWLHQSVGKHCPRDALIEPSQTAIGPMCDAVRGAGGEILKFIGDADVAHFSDFRTDAAATCGARVVAAEQAQTA